MAVVADADVIIDHLNKKSDRLDRYLQAGVLVTTAVVRHELMYGAETAKQREKLRAFLDRITTRVLGPASADLAAQIRQDLDARGETLAIPDVLTAAITITNRDRLLTRNVGHFGRIDGLDLVPLD